MSGGTGSTGIELYRRPIGPGNGWQLFIGGTGVVSNTNGSTWPYFDNVTPNPRITEISRDAANLITVKNPAGGVELSYTHAGDVKINNIGARGTTFYRGMLLYSLEVTNGAFYRKYDAALAGSTGTVLATNDGVNQGTISGGALFVEYDGGDPEPSGGTTYDVGGVSTMLMSSAGGASLAASAGGASTVALSASGGASLAANAGGVSAMTMTATGGAEVGSEITAGGVSAMAMTATGGATVTARAGGASQFTFSVSGGATLSAGAGGASVATMSCSGGASLVAVAGGASAMTMTAAGGGVVNEQVVTVNRVALPAAQLLTTMVLPPVAMLQSVSIQGQYNYRRTL